MQRPIEDDAAPPWSPPPASLTLGRAEVHVWRVALDPNTRALQTLAGTLSTDERERAARFYFPKDRDHFTVARGLLRCLLGRYLGMPPEQLCFGYSPYGKPGLVPEQQGLRFNLSHSNSLALIAVTRERELGVDLEYIRPEVAEESIAERFFSAAEVAALQALPPALRAKAFFHCWTRKEAYIKARGEGLSIRLDQFQVSLSPGQPAALLSVQNDPAEAARWSLRALAPGEGYVGAVAVEEHDWQLCCWEWPPAVG